MPALRVSEISANNLSVVVYLTMLALGGRVREESEIPDQPHLIMISRKAWATE